MTDSDPGRMTDSGSDEESRVKRYASKDVRSPRRPPLVNMTILTVGIGLILFTIYELFFTRPVLFSDERTLAASIEEVESLFDVYGHFQETFLVIDSVDITRLVSIHEVPHDSTVTLESGRIVSANGTATFRVDIDRMMSSLTIKDDLVEVPRLSASVVRFELDDVRLFESRQPRGMTGGTEEEPSSEIRRAAGDRLLTIARGDSAALQRAVDRARTVVNVLVHARGMKVEYRSNDEENSE